MAGPRDGSGGEGVARKLAQAGLDVTGMGRELVAAGAPLAVHWDRIVAAALVGEEPHLLEPARQPPVTFTELGAVRPWSDPPNAVRALHGWRSVLEGVHAAATAGSVPPSEGPLSLASGETESLHAPEQFFLLLA